nr:nucleotide-binding alpha-beta plait domain-containing protein [Tanacetum cinerariifolium]
KSSPWFDQSSVPHQAKDLIASSKSMPSKSKESMYACITLGWKTAVGEAGVAKLAGKREPLLKPPLAQPPHVLEYTNIYVHIFLLKAVDSPPEATGMTGVILAMSRLKDFANGLIQMARRVSDYRIRRIADRGNEEDGPNSRARGDRFYHNRRSADRGNEKVDRDPWNISEIKGLR